MATMIPENVEYFTTKGEKQFYTFLEAVARPDHQYIVWYLPDLNGHEPDFILFSKKLGLILFEVKDWLLEQICEANPKRFAVVIKSHPESRPNPLYQARNYFLNLMDIIKDDGQLLSAEPEHHGNPKIPMNYGVVFPNINKYAYLEKGFGDVIGPDRIFFGDDLHPESDICRDSSGGCFLESINLKFPAKFNFNITGNEYNHLKRLIFPTVCIHLPERRSCKYDNMDRRVKVLDNNQEIIARKFDGGHRIIWGPSGCGKTLVLVHKAAFLKRYNPAINSILFVCFNITLVNYIKRLLVARGIGIGEGCVEVYHFFELCSKILGEEVNYENEEDEYYDLVVTETIERLKERDIKYDAVLVDEGQDLSDDMYKVVTAILNKNTNNLTIALDENQNLYRRKLSWKEVGVNARGRVRRLSWIYRNTSEISRFAGKFLGQAKTDKATGNLELFPGFYDFHGPVPEMKQFANFKDIVSFVADKIKSMHDNKEFPLSEIAVIYCRKSFDDTEAHNIPKLLEGALNSRGILCLWAAENYHLKRSYDIATERVTISTIHSTKGLDYACVFLVGLDTLEGNGWSEEQIRNMTYVAITRARYQLFIPYIAENSLINRLKNGIN